MSAVNDNGEKIEYKIRKSVNTLLVDVIGERLRWSVLVGLAKRLRIW